MSSTKLTKYDLIDSIYQDNDFRKTDIQIIVDSFLSVLKQSIASGKNIELRGFGTFEVRVRKERKNARNPKNGEIVSVPEHCVATFKAGKELKNLLYELDPK